MTAAEFTRILAETRQATEHKRRRHATPIDVMTDVAQRQLAVHGFDIPRAAVDDAIRNALQAVQS